MDPTGPLPLSDPELIRILTASGENGQVDSKAPTRWDGAEESAKLAKDILAFANSRDGGAIVIGKQERDDGGFELVGVSDEQAATFETTKIAQWINSRCEPSVELTAHVVTHESRRFVVITVAEFREMPVICTKPFQRGPKDQPLLSQGAIYVRTANATSEPLRDPKDVRVLVGLATRKQGDVIVKTIAHAFQGRPLVAPAPATDLYLSELQAVRQSLDADIGERAALGTWKVVFHPAAYRRDRWSTTKRLREAVEQVSVRLRSEIPSSRHLRVTDGRVESVSSVAAFGMTASGLVFAAVPYWEDTSDVAAPRWSTNPTLDSNFVRYKWLDFLNTVYSVTELLALLSRLAALYPAEDVSYRVTATALAGRRIVTTTSNVLWSPTEPCRSREFVRERTVSSEALRADWREDAAQTLEDLFQHFEGGDLAAPAFMPHIDRFLSRR